MGEAGLLAFLGKWVPVLCTGAASIIAKLIHDKYKELYKKIQDIDDKTEANEKEIIQLKLALKGIEGEKIGRPEFERVLADLKTEVKEEFSEFRKEFKDQMKEDKNDRKQQFDALFDMIRRLENKKE